MKREFSYKDVLIKFQQQAPRQFWRQGQDDYEELMVTLGAILREGDGETRTFLDGLILSSRRDEAQQLYARRARLSGCSKKAETLRAAPSGRHISSLKEYGDKIGQLLEYDEEQVRYDPPLFQSTVLFDTKRYRGEGKCKKEARQMAAYRACVELKIVAD